MKKLTISMLALVVSLVSGHVSAYTLTGTPDCAVAVTDPLFDTCSGAYLLEGGENDVTNGDATNIVNQLLNDDDIFGTEDWIFGGKEDANGGNALFTVNGINSDFGTITFTDLVTDDYELVLSLKSGQNFSLYRWFAPLGSDTITWETDGTSVNNNGVPRELSHVSLFYRVGDTPEVPEPATLVLLGLGLAGLGMARRRRA